MNSVTPVFDRSDQHDAASHIAAPFAEAANDSDFYSNPLWMVAIALGSLFALLACLLASG